jgi:hypothetical protein
MTEPKNVSVEKKLIEKTIETLAILLEEVDNLEEDDVLSPKVVYLLNHCQDELVEALYQEEY